MDKIQVNDKFFKLYIPESEIQTLVQQVADRISADYRDLDPILCPVLTGAYQFAADLTRCLDFDPEVRFVRFSSYDGMSSTGKVSAALPFPEKCRGRHVIIVEDIIDSGISMEAMIKELQRLEPASIAVCTFFFKPGNFKKEFKVDYYGRTIRNEFIVGYGLDYNGHGRTYKDVYILDEE